MNKLFLASLIFLGVVGCGRGYSEGQRSGVIVKFSKKGLFCKSHEGTMNLGGTSKDGDGNLVPSTWEFTVTDESIVPKIVELQESGQRVTLVYTQWFMSPPCTMDSNYEIVGVK